MFFEQIQISFSDLQKMLAVDAAGLTQYVQLYVTRRFYIGDTDINRKTLVDWEKSGLLPYDYDDKGWRRFSFLEWVWLECINEFRQLGVSIEKIKEIRHILFDVDESAALNFFKEQLENYGGEVNQKETVLAAYNHPDSTNELMREVITKFQMSPFLIYLSALVTSKVNYCIVYNNQNFCSYFLMGTSDTESKEANQEIFSNLVNNSFIVLNLRKVVNKIFQKPELRHNDDFVIDFLSPAEKKIFDHIRQTNAKEIIIKFNDEKIPTHIQVKRNQISKETLNKLARCLKKGNYQDIEFKTRDGKMIMYSETDIIKL